MPVFVLYIKADLENVESIKLPSSPRFCFDVQEAAGTEVLKGVWVSASEEYEVSGSKNHTVNLRMKFDKHSKKECTMNIQSIPKFTRDYNFEDDRNFVPVMAFECRGLEPITFNPLGDQWIVTSKGGKVFENVDLSEKEWSDFCDKKNEPVGIYEFESKIEVYRG
eukprot:CAMPEP_0175067258 /NCGR_PEP_ID=MMETSP0052_2-20121109/16990_1 /TAXON_ID=51329 ORGANISM="Polytomella parva, Strain SAG 63-3" /NCGR_SAMPLE_ID=MMETSP0052_2 /ASSEMBLY_ACC=CAM_ASM_000194 /LENGTH=164 /DNA_ID=CAMNT_0016334103 /DNA_START=64 /DNA_END=558 /DNA_ORIENTATION=-